MNLHFIAEWLDSAFAGFDRFLLSFYHTLAEAAGVFFTPLLKFISFFGEKGWFFIVLGLALILFKKTRKAGFCVLCAIILGATVTNLTLKEAVARLRPYNSGNADFVAWWKAAGCATDSEFSFPSGHVTATTAAMTALVLTLGKKYAALAAPVILFMAASRNYLMVHYPSDVLFAFVIGTLAACASYGITRAAFMAIEKKRGSKFSEFVLESDFGNLFAKKKKTEK